MKGSLTLFGIVCSIALVSCGKDDDSPKINAPIVGVWQGRSIDYEFTPEGSDLGLSDTEEFDGMVEFRDDGSVTYTEDGDESDGTYTVTGNKLTTTVEFTGDFPFTSETFTIKKLTKTKLSLYFRDDDEFETPIGIMEGEIKATVFFERQ